MTVSGDMILSLQHAGSGRLTDCVLALEQNEWEKGQSIAAFAGP